MRTHCDETSTPCTRHSDVSQDVILEYAAIGSRMSSFHHDVASKLQSLMMAVDEIVELGSDNLRSAAMTATAALQGINELLAVNRALTKAPQRRPTSLPEIIARAAARHGVHVRGDQVDVDVNVALPSIAHALDLLLDMLAGPMRGERAVSLEITKLPDCVALGLEATAPFEANNEHIALATFLLVREAGALTCSSTGFVVVLPR